MVSLTEFSAAGQRGKAMRDRVPHATSARYDRRSRRIVVHLSSNMGIFFSPRDAQGLEHATADQLSQIELSPTGYGLHFPQLDADLYLPALIEGVFGSQQWMASRMGAQGGSSKSAAKVAAARENGKRGGRPRQAASNP